MAGSSITVTTGNGLFNWADFDVRQRPLSVAWVSDSAAGTVSLPIASGYASSLTYKSGVTKIIGRIGRITTVPNTGATQPSDKYTITLLDADGVDVLDGALATASGCSNSTAQNWIFSPAIVVNSDLTLTIASAGNSKTGTINLYFVR